MSLPACTDDSADKDGNGVIDYEERESEMESDAFIKIEPGLWETTANFTEINLPQVKGNTKRDMLKKISDGFSSRTCINEEETQKPSADFFGGQGAEDCSYKRFDISGQQAQIIVSCKIETLGNPEISLNGIMEPKQNNFDVVLKMDMPVIGKVSLKGTSQRQHLGDCPST